MLTVLFFLSNLWVLKLCSLVTHNFECHFLVKTWLFLNTVLWWRGLLSNDIFRVWKLLHFKDFGCHIEGNKKKVKEPIFWYFFNLKIPWQKSLDDIVFCLMHCCFSHCFDKMPDVSSRKAVVYFGILFPRNLSKERAWQISWRWGCVMDVPLLFHLDVSCPDYSTRGYNITLTSTS